MADTVYNLTHIDTQLTINKMLDFDVTIRLHPRVLVLNDVVVEVILPVFIDYDTLALPFREVEHIEDGFRSSKEDTPSFYEVLERKSNYIHASYVSPNLKSIEPLSERWKRPLGRFDSIQALSAPQDMQFNMGYYLTLFPKEFRYLKFVHEYDKGFAISCFRTSYPNVSDGLSTSEKELYQKILYDEVLLFKASISDHLFPILSNVETNERILSIYYGVFYTPYQRDYVFRITEGSGDEVVEVYVDDVKIVSLYSYSQSTVTSSEVTLSIGYHKIKIVKLHRVGGSEREIYIKRVATGEEELLNVSGMENLVLGLWHPTDFSDERNKEQYVHNPIVELNQYGLLMESYTPYVILVMPEVSKIQKSFVMSYWFKPLQTLLSNAIVSIGEIDNLYNPYTVDSIDYGNVGLLVDKEDVGKPISLTLIWDLPIPINYIVLYEGRQNNYGHSTKIKIKLYDNTGSFIEPSNIKIQQDECIGVKHIDVEDMWIVIDKEEYNLLAISFENVVDILKIEIEVYVREGWCVTSFVTGLKGYSNFYALDNKGGICELEQLDYSKSLYYDDISNIPQVYKHRHLPSDVKYGSEFIMFALSKGLDDVEIEYRGTGFELYNPFDIEDEELKFFAIYNLYGDKYRFNVYKDYQKNESVEWNYLCYDATTGTLVADKPSNIDVIVRNLTDVQYTPAVITLQVPNYGHGWVCIVNGNIVPCVGKNKKEEYVTDSQQWDTNTVVVELPELQPNQVLSFVLQEGDFSGTITVQELNQYTYNVVYDVYDTSLIIVDTGVLEPKGLKSFYVMNDDTPNPSLVPASLLSYVSYYEIFIINKVCDEGEQEVILDLSSFRSTYGKHVPFRFIDARTKQELPFCYRNSTGEYTDVFTHWDSGEVLVKVNVRAEGTKLLLISGYSTAIPISNFDYPQLDSLNKDSYLILQFNSIIADRSPYQHKVEYQDVEFVPDKEGKPFSAGYYGVVTAYTSVQVSTPDSSFSLTFWLKTRSENVEILYTGDVNDKGLNIKVVNSVLVVEVENNNMINTGLFISDSQWHFISIVVTDDKTVDVYVDNNHAGSITSSSIGRDMLHIGTGVGTFIIDELRLIGREITQNEITLMYQNYRLVTVNNKLQILYKKSPSIQHPKTVITNLIDLSSIQATPVIVHKYPDIETVVIEEVD